MKSVGEKTMKRNRKAAIAWLLAIGVMISGLVICPSISQPVAAQGDCRPVSSLTIQSIITAGVVRAGFNNYIVTFRARSPHVVFCDFVSCNNDKFSYKPLISSNITAISGGGCNGIFNVLTPISGQYYRFNLGFKVRFHENALTSYPGVPRRKTGVLMIDLPPCPPDTSCSSAEEVNVTAYLVDAPDDGTDS